MHKVGHWIGIDVHDVGKNCVLESGMTFTVEPGIYIAANSLVDSRWHNIGVRIEDEVLVTENGCEILTKMIPKNPAEIEAVMQG